MNDTNTLTWSLYQRKGLSEMRPYVEGEDLAAVSISAPDKEAGSPKLGDMIARNPKNHEDQWLVAAKYFAENLEPARTDEDEDDGWHQTEGGTQALEIAGLGVIVRCKGYGMLHLPSARMDKGHIVHIHA
jgi:hypothetical protein